MIVCCSRKVWRFAQPGDAAAKTGDKGGAAGATATVQNIQGMEIYQFTKHGLALLVTVQGTKYWRDDKLNKQSMTNILRPPKTPSVAAAGGVFICGMITPRLSIRQELSEFRISPGCPSRSGANGPLSRGKQKQSDPFNSCDQGIHLL